MYTRYKLTLANRVTIPVGAVVGLEVKEDVEVPKSPLCEQQRNYGMFYIRKQFAMKGLFQAVHTPFPEGFKNKPIIVVENRHVADIELLANEEVGEFWLFEYNT